MTDSPTRDEVMTQLHAALDMHAVQYERANRAEAQRDELANRLDDVRAVCDHAAGIVDPHRILKIIDRETL